MCTLWQVEVHSIIVRVNNKVINLFRRRGRCGLGQFNKIFVVDHFWIILLTLILMFGGCNEIFLKKIVYHLQRSEYYRNHFLWGKFPQSFVTLCTFLKLLLISLTTLFFLLMFCLTGWGLESGSMFWGKFSKQDQTATFR